jgi:hypothetical protein
LLKSERGGFEGSYRDQRKIWTLLFLRKERNHIRVRGELRILETITRDMSCLALTGHTSCHPGITYKEALYLSLFTGRLEAPFNDFVKLG